MRILGNVFLVTRRNILQAAMGVLALKANARPRAPRQSSDAALRIAIMNQSSVSVSQDIVDAIQSQVDNDLYPLWAKRAAIRLLDSQTQPESGEVPCTILDYTDSPCMLSYHFVSDDGSPYIKVFALTAQYYGRALSSLLSHEILETIVDPWVSFYCLVDNGNGSGSLYNLEVCDPVQCSFYDINGVTVSDFVTPDFYLPAMNKTYDHLALLSAPLTTQPGGNVPMKTINGLPSLSSSNWPSLKAGSVFTC